MCLKLAESRSTLKTFPRVPNVDVSVIINMITDFCCDLKEMVHGNGANKTFIQENRATYELFKRAIRGTAPDFKPFVHGASYRSLYVSDENSEEESESSERTGETFDLNDVRRIIKRWILPVILRLQNLTCTSLKFHNLGAPRLCAF